MKSCKQEDNEKKFVESSCVFCSKKYYCPNVFEKVAEKCEQYDHRLREVIKLDERGK